jgi:hypothetical protein
MCDHQFGWANCLAFTTRPTCLTLKYPEKKIKLKESDYIEKGGSIASPVESPVGHIGLVIVRISTWIDFLETQLKPEWYLLILLFTVLRCEISWLQLVASSNGCRHHHISICFYRDHWSGSLGIPFESSSHRNAMFRRRRGSDGHFIIVNAHPTVTLWWVWPIFLIQNRNVHLFGFPYTSRLSIHGERW